MMAYDARKNTTVCRTNPNDVGQPPTATPGIMLFTNRNVRGFATRKKMSAE